MRDHHGHPERGYERFFAFLGLFLFSMTVLVLAGNFLVLFVGWELVGLSSFLLIGFYYQKPEAAKAARKAFIVNRVGDFGFALGIWLIYLTFGTLDYQKVFDSVSLAMRFDGDTYASIVPQLQGLLGADRVPDVTAASALVLQVQDRITCAWCRIVTAAYRLVVTAWADGACAWLRMMAVATWQGNWFTRGMLGWTARVGRTAGMNFPAWKKTPGVLVAEFGNSSTAPPVR